MAHIHSICLTHIPSHNKNRIENCFKKIHFIYPAKIAFRKVISQCNWLNSIPRPHFFDDPFSASPSWNPAFVCLQQFFPCLFYWLHFFPFIILVHPLNGRLHTANPLHCQLNFNFTASCNPLALHTPRHRQWSTFLLGTVEHFPFRFSNYYHCFQQERL